MHFNGNGIIDVVVRWVSMLSTKDHLKGMVLFLIHGSPLFLVRGFPVYLNPKLQIHPICYLLPQVKNQTYMMRIGGSTIHLFFPSPYTTKKHTWLGFRIERYNTCKKCQFPVTHTSYFDHHSYHIHHLYHAWMGLSFHVLQSWEGLESRELVQSVASSLRQ